MKKSRTSGVLSFFIVMTLCCWSAISFAEDNIAGDKHNIYVYLLKDRLDAEWTLSYNQLLDNVAQEVRDTVEFVPAPLRRSARAFLNDRSSCVFPSAIDALRRVHKEALEGLPLVASAPIDYVSIRLYTRKTDPVISTKTQLKGKVVGHLLGSVGETLLDAEDVTVQNVSDEAQLLKMLFARRFDILMGHHPDIPMATKRLALEEVHFDPDMIVYNTSVHLVCHDFDGVEDLLGKINFRIREIRGNGLAQEILGEEAMIVPLSEDKKITM